MGKSDKIITSTNPGKNYEILGQVEASFEDEVVEKVKKAKQALAGWKDLGIDGRVELLRGITEEIKKRKEEIAQLVTKEMGRPIVYSRMEVDEALDYFHWYLNNTSKYLCPEISFEDDQNIQKVFYEPIGVAAVISSWNFPITNFVWGVAQNLVVGNTVVFKHSEEVPLCGKLIEEIVNNAHLPEGVFSEVYGDSKVGDCLVHQDVNLFWFTGSTKVGKYLYQVAAEKFIKVLLELGGSAPGIVFEDVDVDTILDRIYTKKFSNCGQVCSGLKRLIVHESKFDEVVEKLKSVLESKKLGNPEDDGTDLGPLVARQQLDLIEEQVKNATDKGARVITGGKEPEGLEGAYYEPTILINITNNMRVWQEEVFGPVLPIISFKTEEEAIRLANDTRYGLGSYVFTRDKERALRIASYIQSGIVAINNALYMTPSSPFGGFKDSGIGKEHGKYGLRELSQIKVVLMEK
jgi:succinate-semialdehyde dehydrogenase/glutarate-semialdehyde dehydrogenase